MDQQPNVNIKISDEIQTGVYANMMMAAHTKDEFILDFISMFPPTGVVASRVLVSPAHAKRILRALAENIKNYETNFGDITESNGPNITAANSTSEKSFGFESK